VRGTVAGWDAETALTISESKANEKSDVLLVDKIDEAYQKGGYNPWIASNPDSEVQKLLYRSNREGDARLFTAEVKATRADLFTLAGGDAGIAFGLSYMHESASDTPDAMTKVLQANGTFKSNIENQGSSEAAGSRSVKAIYGELALPVLKNIEIQAALRYDHYSDAGGSLNPKLGFAYQPIDWLKLRGTATTTFKAPTLQQTNMRGATAYNNNINDVARCGPLGYGPDKPIKCKYSAKLYVDGAPDLKPETTTNYTFGMVLQPIEQVSATIDWYSFATKDAIETLNAQYILDNEDKDPAMAALIERAARNPALEAQYPGLNKGRIVAFKTPFVNVGQLNVSGIDVDLRFKQAFEIGKFTLRNQTNFVLTNESSDIADAAPLDKLGGLYTPKWRNVFTVGFETPVWDISAATTTYASVLDEGDVAKPTNEGREIGSYSMVRLSGSYKASKTLRITAGIDNLLDRAGPFSVYLNEYVAGTTGRSAYVNVTYKF
ncbi:TonB-dependent receptor, partial [Iodobacter sp. LRB]|uniref:TonB-dependent receptor domain-containing protein n=1 Tax=Iodobacter sp. LRB TaxID=3127955 RepID=UPI00307F0B8D